MREGQAELVLQLLQLLTPGSAEASTEERPVFAKNQPRGRDRGGYQKRERRGRCRGNGDGTGEVVAAGSQSVW